MTETRASTSRTFEKAQVSPDRQAGVEMRPGRFKGDLPGSSATWSESPDLSGRTQSLSSSFGHNDTCLARFYPPHPSCSINSGLTIPRRWTRLLCKRKHTDSPELQRRGQVGLGGVHHGAQEQRRDLGTRGREPQTSSGAFISKQALGQNTRDHRCICPPAPAVLSVCVPLASFVRPWLSNRQLTSVREATGDWERIAIGAGTRDNSGKGGRS